MRCYLGIDTGIKTTALTAITREKKIIYIDAILDDGRPDRRMDPARLASITRRTQESIQRAHLPLDLWIAIEQPFVTAWKSKGGPAVVNQSNLKTHGVYSVLVAAMQERVDNGLARKLLVVNPATLKSFLGLPRSHTKSHVARAVQERWGFTNTSHDITDAFALAQYARSQDQ